MFRHYVVLIRNRWRLILIITLGACIISLLHSLASAPIYRATASFVVFPNEGLTSSRDVVSSLDTLEKRSIITTYAEIVSSDSVAENTIREAKIDDLNNADYIRTVNVQEESNVFSLNIAGPDPLIAVFLANEIGENGIGIIKSIYQVFDIVVLDEAKLPTEPISPRPVLSLLIFGAVGLAFGIFTVILSYNLSRPLEAIRERINVDPQTGAYKKPYFLTRVEQRLANAPDAHLSLGLIELEGLKEYVSSLPEAVYSDLMHRVSETFKEELRGNDIFGLWEKSSIIVMLQDTPPQPAARTLLRLRTSLQKPVQESSELYEINMRPTIGLTYRSGEETLSEMIENLLLAAERANQSEYGIYVYPSEVSDLT